MDQLIYSMGERSKIGVPLVDGRMHTPFRGGSSWNDRMLHTVENILNTKEQDEPACYTEKALQKLQRCPAYLEWHPDKAGSLCAGPRAKKIAKDWYNMIEIARILVSSPAARERYYKYGVWTDGNVDQLGRHQI